MMKDANRSSNVSRSLVFKWHKRFSEGRESSFVSSTQRGIRRCLASGWSDTGSVLSVEASTLKSADLQRK